MPLTTPACDHCGKTTGTTLIAMMPGRDGKEWFLCSACWIEGRTPMRLGRFKVTEIADPHLYDALVSASKRTAGLIQMEATPEMANEAQRSASKGRGKRRSPRA